MIQFVCKKIRERETINVNTRVPFILRSLGDSADKKLRARFIFSSVTWVTASARLPASLAGSARQAKSFRRERREFERDTRAAQMEGTEMTYNVGGVDRILRILLGIVLVVLGLVHVLTGGWAIAAYIVGAIAFVSGVVRFCPAWALLGVNTCPMKPAQQK